MKVISIISNFKHQNDFSFTGIIVTHDCEICFYKNGSLHRENGPAVIYEGSALAWARKDHYYGFFNDFTNKSWKKKVKILKREAG